MTIHRFFLPLQSFQKERIMLDDNDLIKQISFVLRAKLGDKMIFLDNQGYEYLSELISFSKNKIEAKILEKTLNKNESDLNVVLYQAIPKQLEKFELILQKATELGVKAIVPIITEFCQRDFLPKRDRLERIIKEAAEQSERGLIPQLLPEIKFEKGLSQLDKKDLNLFFYERGEGEAISCPPERCQAGKLLATSEGPKANSLQLTANSSKITIFVGPEGGFSGKELELVKSYGDKIKFMSLGPRILRTETAAIAAVVKILL